MVRLSWEAVLAWRTARQRLATRAPAATLLDVVVATLRRPGAGASSAELTLWARWTGSSAARSTGAVGGPGARQDVGDARHAAPPARAELPRSGSARARLKPRHHQPAWLRAPRARRATGRGDARRDPGASSAAAPLTREELADAVAARDRRRRARRQAARRLRRPAQARGVRRRPLLRARATAAACGSPPRSLARRRGTASDPTTRRAEVARRYLARLRAGDARAVPALVRHDLPRPGRPWLRGARRRAGEVEVEGERALDARRRRRRGGRRASRRASVRLLPAFDQYVVTAPRDGRRRRCPPAFRARVYRPQGWLSPVLLVDGRMRGVWSHERRRRDAAAVEVEPFAPPSARGARRGARPRRRGSPRSSARAPRPAPGVGRGTPRHSRRAERRACRPPARPKSRPPVQSAPPR